MDEYCSALADCFCNELASIHEALAKILVSLIEHMELLVFKTWMNRNFSVEHRKYMSYTFLLQQLSVFGSLDIAEVKIVDNQVNIRDMLHLLFVLS